MAVHMYSYAMLELNMAVLLPLLLSLLGMNSYCLLGHGKIKVMPMARAMAQTTSTVKDKTMPRPLALWLVAPRRANSKDKIIHYLIPVRYIYRC